MDANKIDKYLSGEMDAHEQAAFEKKMQHDPALSKEVEGLRLLTGAIEDAILEDRVSEALSGIPAPGTPKRSFWWTGALLLAVAAIIAIAIYPFAPPGAADPADQPAIPPQTATDSSGAEERRPPLPPETEEEQTPPGPIAANTPAEASVAAPPHPAPTLRGNGQETDTARQAILNSVWHAPYPPGNLSLNSRFSQVHALLQNRNFSKSYSRLQLMERRIPDNDTLFFLKGYCLLESGEGDAALSYFDRIQDKQPFGADLLEWYRGLSLLLMGKDEEAKRAFLKIAERPDHLFRPYAASALEKLK
ncbi:MAG: hypothetical protein NXI25_20720 [bacterium]|nr:hypothetical protein [bacterium]